MRSLLFVSTFTLLLLTSCNSQRHLQKATVYVKGNPPVQIMAVRPDADGANADPMRYSLSLMQQVADAWKAEGLEVVSLPLEESFIPEKSSDFVMEIGMVMVQEQIEPGPETPNGAPKEGMAVSLQVNVSAMLIGVDKKGESTFKDYQIVQQLSVEEQAKMVGKNPTIDIYQAAMDKGVQELVRQSKEQMLQAMNSNTSNL